MASDPLEQARELLVGTIDAADKGAVIPADFPKWALSRFNKIGRRLWESDALVLRSPTTQRTCRYNQTVRRNLVRPVALVEDDFTAVGAMQGFDGVNHVFKIVTADHAIEGSFPAALDNEFRKSVAAGTESGLYVDGARPFRVDGTAQFRNDLIKSFSAESITPIDFATGQRSMEDVIGRVQELLNLPDGWLDGDGVPPSPELAERFLQTMVTVADQDGAAPSIYPTPEGGLRAEWDLPEHEVVWEFNPGEQFAMKRRVRSTDAEEIDLTSAVLSAADIGEKLAGLLLADESEAL